MKHVNLIAVLAIALGITGCQDETDTHTNNSEETVVEAPANPIDISDKKEADMITLNGHIEFKPFEGGFYAFIGDDGSKWVLQGLDKAYHRHGLALTVTGTPMPEMLTTTQFGTVMKVDSISNVDDSSVKPKPASPQEL